MFTDLATEIRPLLGSIVSHAWKGYGSAIFLELGHLTPPESTRLNHPSGEWCITIEWDWRLESGTEILYGSSNAGPEIANRIVELEGSRIESINAFGDVPELTVSLSNGSRIRTASMVTGDPAWSIKLSEKKWLYIANGKLRKDEGRAEASEEETQAFEREAQTVQRWGTPMVAPAGGSCFHCSSYVGLDGHAWLLEYGVCTSPDSPMDGKIVNKQSGCPKFTPSE